MDALRKAIACGADINQSCSKYKICLDKRKSTDSQLTSMLLMSMPSHAASMASLSIANLNDLEIKGVGASEHNSYSATLDDSVAYLDVHSGISMGYMAGVDIGHDNRWEYFLIGKPLSDVALAEADAGQGELVISPIAHSVFHPAINTERTHSTRTTASFTRLSHATMTNLDDTPVRSPMLSPLKRTARIEHQQKFVAFESQSNDSTKGFVDTFFQAPRDTTHQHITVDSRENLNGNAIDKIFSNESDLPSVRSSADLKTLKLDLDNLMCSQSSDNLGFGSLKDASESCDDFNFEDGVYPGCLPCGCLVTPSGSFKICNTRRFVTKFGQSHYSMCSELSEVDLTLTKSFTQSISEKVTNISAENDSFNNSKNVVQVWSELAEIFDTTVANNSGSGKVPRRCSEPSPLGIGSQQSKKSNPLWSIFSDNYKLDNRVALSYASSGDRQNRDYLRWLLQCLLDDVVRHVHYVVRATAKIPTNLDFAHRETQSSDYRFMLTRQLRLSGSKTNESEDFVESIQTFLSKFQNISAGNRLKSISGSFYISSDKQGSPTSDFNEYQRSPLRKTSGLTVGKRRSRYHGESYLSAELRNVTVMFISIEAFNRTLLDSPSSTSPAVVSTDSEKMRDGLLEYRINKIDLEKVNNVSGLLSFLPRSNVEYADDHEILNKYQECIEVIVNALHARGGQLRQFIVDDKGTVSIGTFGLRGSAHEDDAAAAVESAQDIIIGLQKIGQCWSTCTYKHNLIPF